jgi:Putative Flp pilus-assembly TadE/G-like
MQTNTENERGQSMVLIALLIVALVAFLGLIFDVGNAYAQRRVMQNAADAGSLAGSQILAQFDPNNIPPIPQCSPPPQSAVAYEQCIYQQITAYAVASGASNDVNNIKAQFVDSSGNPYGAYLPGNGGIPQYNGNYPAGVQVWINTSFQTFFLGVVNAQNGAAAANATSIYGTIQQPQDLQPLARKCDQPSLDECGFQTGQIYDIWNGGGPGNFGYLSWNGDNNAPNLRAELVPGNPIDYAAPNNHPCSASFPVVGCWVQGEPGVKATVSSELDQYWKETGNVMTIIIWDESDGGGSHTNYRVKGYASFIVTDFDLNGHGYINGKFVKWVEPGDICQSNCQNNGTSGIKLTH